MTSRELQRIYYGAYSFQETEDGWLQAFQYSKEQMAYFESCIAKGIDFWYDRCMATSAKTLEKLHIPCRLEIGPEGGHGFADGTGTCIAGRTGRAVSWYEGLKEK